MHLPRPVYLSCLMSALVAGEVHANSEAASSPGLTVAHPAPPRPRAFRILAADAKESLQAFSNQAGTPVIYIVEQVRGVRTNSVEGYFSPREALEKILANTVLTVVEDDRTGSLMVKRRASTNPAVLPGQGTVTATDDQELYPVKSQPTKTRSGLLSALLAVVTASGASAQSQPAAPASATEKDKIVELSPFEVNSSDDTGYYASNTMSGTRIKSRVEDLGASITVITKQQLQDTAAIDINDIFKYEANTEGSADYTPFNAAAATNDTLQGGQAGAGGPAVSTRLRGLAAPNISIGNFSGTARIPIDTYNIDSVEISRGPNSTLFGLGSAAGTVNINRAEANVSRASNEVQLRGDDYGGYRASFNLNRPILKDQLAVRIAALYASNAYKQKPSSDLTKRITGDFVYKPFKNTTIHGMFEQYLENRQAPNSITPRDGITEWLNSGRPTWNPLTSTATVNGTSIVLPASADNTAAFPAGLYVNTTTYSRPSMFIDQGKIQLWEVNRLGTSANPNAGSSSNVRLLSSGSVFLRGLVNGGVLYQVPGTTNKALYDWTSINAVPTNWNYDKAKLYTFEVVQKLAENLYARAGWHLEDSMEFNRNISSPPVLLMDVNQYLVDGRANPYFLRPFIQTFEPQVYKLPEYNDNLQAQLAYELNLAKETGWRHWLGDHKMLGYYEGRRITDGTFRFREAIIDPNHVWTPPGTTLNYANGFAVGRPTYRYYVGGPNALGYQPGYAPPKSGVEGTYNLRYFNATSGQWVDDPSLFGLTASTSGQVRQEITSRGVVDQSSFLDNRVVVTAGLRTDFNRTRNSNGVTLLPNGFNDFGSTGTWGPWTNAEGKTRTTGIVVKPLRWFGLSYNQSSSFLPQPPAIDLTGTVLPNTYGHGRDIGFFVNLFSDKLVLSVKAYKDIYINDRNSDSTIGGRLASIEAGTLLASQSGSTYGLYNFALNVAQSRLGPNASQDQINSVVDSITKFTPGFKAAVAAANNGSAIRGTNNTEAKGGEVDLTYNPISNWTIKFTGAQTKSIATSIENNLTDYIAERMPYWLSVKDDQGNPWWTSKALSSQSAQSFYSTSVEIPIKISQALLGKSNPQVKEYTWRLTTNYRFTEGRLNNFNVGGAARWNSESAIGYRGVPPDADGVVRSLDVNQPVYDPARYSFDAWAGYNLRLFHDRIRAKIQLNVQDVFENGGLRAYAVNPDGTPYNFRIINPRKFVLTTTYDF